MFFFGNLSSSSLARPKIGLALGGGGARGAAHVGVIRYLEEHNIPVDYIAGTSMGAIVGGMYASGLSSREMEQVLDSMDWADMFTDNPGYRNLSFRRKLDQSADLFPIEFGVKGTKILMPGGLITGQKVRFKLQTMTLHTEGIQSFDDLCIPFRAVATDIETGDKVVLSKGHLAEAIHASFAIPGIIAPVKINGKLLVDGGLVSNVPVDTVREMGADIVIAVNVGSDLADKTKLQSFTSVTKQMVDLTLYNNIAAELPGADIVIMPDLTGFSSADFEKASEIVPSGYEAAERVSSILEYLELEEEEYHWLMKNYEMEIIDKTDTVSFIDIINTSSVSNKWILKNIRTRVGTPLDLTILKNDLNWLYQTNEFTLIDFHLLNREEKTGLSIVAREKPWGNDTLRFGLTMEDNFKGDSYYRFNARYTNTRINSLGAEWQTDIQIGREGLFETEFYQPLAYKTNFFTSIKGTYHRFYANYFEDSVKIGDYRVYQYLGEFDLGVELGKYGEIRTGCFRGYIDGDLASGKELVSRQKFQIGGLRSIVTIDQLDDPAFPTEGIYFSAEYTAFLEFFGGVENYQIVQAFYQEYGRWGNNTVFFHAGAGTKIGRSLPYYLKFDLGGPFSLSGYEQGAVSGQYLGIARMGYFREIAFLPAVVGSGLYVGGYLEAGNALDDIDNVDLDDLIYTANVFLGLDTFLGPVMVGYGAADSGNDSFYLKLGHFIQ